MGIKVEIAVAAAMVVGAMAVIFSASPLLWAIGKWHCWWFAAAPICQ